MIGDSVDTIRRVGGRDVHGFLAPAISTTETFFDLLPEFGIRYTLDMVCDDQPIPVRVRQGKLISLPYSFEFNDIRAMGARGFPPERYAAMVKAAFDQLYEEGAETGMVLCMPIHPFVIGQPHRIAALADVLKHVTAREHVWLATAGEIANWYIAHHYDEVAAFASRQEALR
jgi:peptidoglycan/xylan/chitin deacetylase (PgdA/CDA1 family)